MSKLESIAMPPLRSHHWLESPGILLIICGTLIGFGFPLAKVAAQAQVSISVWLMFYSLGACLVLLPLLVAKRQLALHRSDQWRYVSLAGPITFVGPNMLVYFTVPHVGAGFTGLMFALSPVCTMFLAYVMGLDRLSFWRTVGLVLGLGGAISISFARGGEIHTGSLFWVSAALTIPVVLASGNIYRSLAWPTNSPPELLAFWSHAVALVFTFTATQLLSPSAVIATVIEHPVLIGTQLLLAGLAAPLTFRLQRNGGPVLLSQMGQVAAAASLLVATLLLGEVYSTAAWLSAGVVGVGVLVTLYGKRKGV